MDATGDQCLAQAMAAIAGAAEAPAVVLIGHSRSAGVTRDAIEAAGGAVVDQLDEHEFANGAAPLPRRAVCVLDAGGLDEASLDAALHRIGRAIDDAGASVVISFASGAIDTVASAMLGKPVQLLCDPSPADLAFALTLAANAADLPTLHDSGVREGEADRLKRLNDEVARIADVLSRLTRREAAERPQGLETTARDVLHPPVEIAIEPGEVRRAIRNRRMRDQFFGAGLFEEPGWDMLLDLFAAELERTRVSVSSLCIAAAVAPTTALRWISKLTDAGLFERHPDPFDRRRAYMELSERASRAMRDYVAALRRSGLSLG